MFLLWYTSSDTQIHASSILRNSRVPSYGFNDYGPDNSPIGMKLRALSEALVSKYLGYLIT